MSRAFAIFLILGLMFLSREAQAQRSDNFPVHREKITPPSDPEKFWLFILAGQSNMAGRGLVEPQDTLPHPRILAMDENQHWVLAKEPLHFYEPALTGLDCGLSFGKRLIQSVPEDVTIGLIPCAVGGSSIEQWLGDSVRKEVRLFSNFKSRLDAARQSGRIKGIIWHQGESNANEPAIKTYGDQLEKLIYRFRLECENEYLPFVLGELGSFAMAKDKSGFDSINRIFHETAASDPLISVISTKDLGHKGDSLHFDSPALRMMGTRYAEAMLRMPLNHRPIQIRNDRLAISMNLYGDIAFTDLENDTDWGSRHVGWVTLINGSTKEQISLTRSEFSCTQSGDTILFQFKGIRGEHVLDEEFKMAGKLMLDSNYYDLEITHIESAYFLEEIEYPAHLLTVKSGVRDGYIVVPHLQGVLYPSRYDAGFMRYGQNIWDLIADKEEWWNFESGNLNMPWFGASLGNSSIMSLMLSSSDAALHVIGNAVVGNKGLTVNARQGQNPGTRISSLSPIWKSSKGKLSYSRTMRIELVDKGYVGMAKRYKEYAKESGRYVTLREKIKRNPEFEKIIGAPDIKVYCYTNRLNNPYFKAWSEPVLNGYSKVNTTFKQVEEMAQDLHELNVEKCMFLLGGWNRMGYDREHVDMWPPAEAAGGIRGLKKAAKTVKSKGYLFALHDNYDDFYPDAPSFDEKYILRNRDGSLHKGGVWDGGLCYITCPDKREDLLNRNMALVQASVPLNAYYFDVVTNTSHYECYDPEHPITRTEDLQYRLKLLDNIVQRGLVIGGERGTDWAMPVVGFCEGLSGGGTGYHRGITYRSGLTVPLFYLVYRECVVGYWQHGTPHGREDHANHVLLDLLYGQPSSWSIEYAHWEDLKPMIKETYDLLGRLHERTAHAAMVDHRYLSADHMVQMSELSDGTRIWVNFGITTFEKDGIKLPPKGFSLSGPDREQINGTVSRRITYDQ